MKLWSFSISFYCEIYLEFCLVEVVFIPAPNGFIILLCPTKLPYAMLRECMK